MQTTQSQLASTITAHAVQENFTAYFRIFAGLPGINFVEEENITLVASRGLPGSQVLKTNFGHESAAREFNATLRQVGRHTNAIDWMIWPDDRPHELGPQMVEWGAEGGPDGEWMLHGNIGKQPGTWLVIDLTTLAEMVPIAGEFHVERVQDAVQFDVWAEINARGFGSSDYRAFRSAYLRHGFDHDGGTEAIHFVGFVGEQPVTSSTLLIAGGSASAYNISTPIELRGRGYGSAITHATLKAARDRGFQHSWIWSSPMGRSVYQKLGFVITDFGIREYQWKKRT